MTHHTIINFFHNLFSPYVYIANSQSSLKSYAKAQRGDFESGGTNSLFENGMRARALLFPEVSDSETVGVFNFFIRSKKIFINLILLCSALTMHAVEFSHVISHDNPSMQTIAVTFNLAEHEAILAPTVHVSINNPDMQVSTPSISISPVKQYIPEFKQNKQIYNQSFVVTAHITCNKEAFPADGSLHISYLSTLENSQKDAIFPIQFDREASHEKSSIISSNLETMMIPMQSEVAEHDHSWVAYFQNLVEQAKTPWAQILLAIILGLLLSLTPCIYPMIPITIGILHSHGKKSLLSNFLGSLSYACGLATTFACMGLLATVAGNSFGSLLSQPIFVIALVLFIGYMSLTMIGIVDMYVPPFMKGEVKFYKNFGPYVSAFLFGAISGTIASPCVSPGLALLLSIVATMGSKLLGFLLLFAFGIGLSTPLIIIGTFSNSLHHLPRSGMWMVEIKKALGFFMLATCFYYLANILPVAIVYWLFTAFTLFTAIFYLNGSKNGDTTSKTAYNIIGIIMIGITLFMITQSYEKTFYKETINAHTSVTWQADYATALAQAKESKTLLLVDFWANHCTICKAIDKKVFKNNQFNHAIGDTLTFVKIDATNSYDTDYIKLRELYKVYAQPTILLVDPTTETVLRKWTSEPYSMSIEDFVAQLKKFTA